MAVTIMTYLILPYVENLKRFGDFEEEITAEDDGAVFLGLAKHLVAPAVIDSTAKHLLRGHSPKHVIAQILISGAASVIGYDN